MRARDVAGVTGGVAIGVSGTSRDGGAVARVTLTGAAWWALGAWRRLRLPVAMWSAAFLGGVAWLGAVGVGTHAAADQGGGDIGRLGQAWPALTVALVAGPWSIRPTHAPWRRVASFLALLPVFRVLQPVGWAHGWVAGSVRRAGGSGAPRGCARCERARSWRTARVAHCGGWATHAAPTGLWGRPNWGASSP